MVCYGSDAVAYERCVILFINEKGIGRMTKNETAREIIESLRSIYAKSEVVDGAIGVNLYEAFGFEFDDLLRIAIDLLGVPPWDKDEDIVWNYVTRRADYSYDEMLDMITQARAEFVPQEYDAFCELQRETYGGKSNDEK